MKAKTKLTVLIVLAVLLPVILMSFAQFEEQRTFYDKNTRASVYAEMDRKIDHLRRWIALKRAYVEQNAEVLEAYINEYGFSASIVPLLTDVKESDPSFLSVYITNTDGQNFISDFLVPRVDGRKRDWYQNAKITDVGGTAVLPVYTDVLTGNQVITISAPLYRKGHFAGVVGFDIVIDDIITKLEADKQAGLILANRTGQQIYSSANVMTYSHQNYSEVETKPYKTPVHEEDWILKTYWINEFQIEAILLHRSTKYTIEQWIQKNSVYFLLLLVGICLVVKYLVDRIALIAQNPVQFAALQDLHIQIESIREVTEVECSKAKEKRTQRDNQREATEEKLARVDQANADQALLLDTLEGMEAQHNALMDHTPALVCVVDSAGMILQMNKQLKMYLPEEGKEISVSCIFEEARAEKRAPFMEVLTGRNYSELELSVQTKNNEKLVVKARTVRLMKKGAVETIVIVCSNVSEKVKLDFDFDQRNQEIRIVNDVSKSLATTDDLQKTLQRIVDKVSIFIHARICTIRLVGHDQHLHLHAFSGSHEEMVYHNPPAQGNSHIGWALGNNQIIRIRSVNDMIFPEEKLENLLEQVREVVYIPLSTNDEYHGVMSVGCMQLLDRDQMAVLRSLADQAAIAADRNKVFFSLQGHYYKTIEALATAVEEKMPNRAGHTKRVSELASLVGRYMYLEEKEINEVYIAGLLHDIGKLGIRDDILMSKDRSVSDQLLMDGHPALSRQLLEPIGLSESILDGIYYHHKRYDCTGFPLDDACDTQPYYARIIQAVDDLDGNLCAHAKVDMSHLQTTLERMSRDSGQVYCPEILAVLVDITQTSPEGILGLYNHTREVKGVVAI